MPLPIIDYFSANGEVIKFEGFLKVYLEGTDEENEEQEGMLPALKVNEALLNNYITATERYTRPPVALYRSIVS